MLPGNSQRESCPHVATPGTANTNATLNAEKSRKLIAPTTVGVLKQNKVYDLHVFSGRLVLEFELGGADMAFNETGVTLGITDAARVANMNTVDAAHTNR